MKTSLWIASSLVIELVVLGCGGTSSSSDGGSDGCTYKSQCSAPNGNEIHWIALPAGNFEMGCSPDDSNCNDSEKPVHTVNVPAFEMSETPITQAQYEAQLGTNPSNFSSCANCPVETVKWHEAKAFCEAVSARLPTEAEWEYAARAGSLTPYYSGNDPSCLDEIAWHGGNSSSQTHPVAEKLGNDYCLFDMVGNVWEWVDDCWHDDYIGSPTDGTAWLDGACTYRVLRGGSYGAGPVTMRTSNRDGDYPDMYFISYPTGPGFRCARDIN
ncbi:MAG: formylglycine-generating enzyme family protein [Deltaproteobacteria bacterium]|nr:formylglycine-generating enzyme family protein [Deltaproteobacteria bacterium]